MSRRVFFLLIALCGLVSSRLHAETGGYAQPLSVLEQRSMVRLLHQAEQNLKTTLKWVAASAESDASSWSESHRSQLFDVHSRTQQSVRVLMLQVERLGLSTDKETARAFTDEYGAFSTTLRALHRAVVMKESPLGWSESEQFFFDVVERRVLTLALQIAAIRTGSSVLSARSVVP